MIERHESFGIVSINRLNGRVRLFGSHLEDHPVGYELTVQRAERIHDTLHFDRFMPLHDDAGYLGRHLVSVRLSAAQFTDMITNMNNGMGVPATITEHDGVAMEPVPAEHKEERRQIADDFKAKMEDVKASLQPYVESIETILGKKAIGKKDREDIQGNLTRLIREVSTRAGFTMDMFSEAVDKMETHAKAEVESYAESVIRSAGIAHIKKLAEARGMSLHEIVDVEALPAAKEK